MPKALDLAGQKFGRLTVIKRVSTPVHWKTKKRTHWLCKCDCGKETTVLGTSLHRGITISCGCFHRENHTIHGHSVNYKPSPTYYSWECMKARCNNQTNDNYKYYGGKGIRVCERWAEFKNFLADMGERPSKKYTIERLDSNKGYEPENCIWADSFVQNNHKTSNYLITFDNQILSISQWARKLGTSSQTIRGRLKLGWDIERALTTPLLHHPYPNRGRLFITWNNETLSIAQWARKFNFPYKLLCERMKRYGYTLEQALRTPKKSYR